MKLIEKLRNFWRTNNLSHCSDGWENLMPINVFSICYNCPPSQLVWASYKLSLWRLFISWPAYVVYSQLLLQLSSHLIKASWPAQPFRGMAHTHTVYVCSSALTPSIVRSALAGPWDLQGHPDTADHKSASHIWQEIQRKIRCLSEQGVPESW